MSVSLNGAVGLGGGRRRVRRVAGGGRAQGDISYILLVVSANKHLEFALQNKSTNKIQIMRPGSVY